MRGQRIERHCLGQLKGEKTNLVGRRKAAKRVEVIQNRDPSILRRTKSSWGKKGLGRSDGKDLKEKRKKGKMSRANKNNKISLCARL